MHLWLLELPVNLRFFEILGSPSDLSPSSSLRFSNSWNSTSKSGYLSVIPARSPRALELNFHREFHWFSSSWAISSSKTSSSYSSTSDFISDSGVSGSSSSSSTKAFTGSSRNSSTSGFYGFSGFSWGHWLFELIDLPAPSAPRSPQLLCLFQLHLLFNRFNLL